MQVICLARVSLAIALTCASTRLLYVRAAASVRSNEFSQI